MANPQLGIGTASWGQPYGFDAGVQLDDARDIYNRARELGITSVSYTHLTLPTIYSV